MNATTIPFATDRLFTGHQPELRAEGHTGVWGANKKGQTGFRGGGVWPWEEKGTEATSPRRS